MTSRYSSTERKGINAVEEIILSFDWIFREQSVSDMGVDAQIEICEDGYPTGRLIAVQVKSGESWFRESNADGWIYRGSLAHLDYWTSHSLPVIIILYNPVSHKMWWSLVSNQVVHRTNSGWKIVVPFSKQLNASAKDLLRPIALLGFEQRQRLEYIAQQFMPGSFAVESSSSLSLLLSALQSAENSIDIASPFLSRDLFWALKTASHKTRVRAVISDPKMNVSYNNTNFIDNPNLEIARDFLEYRSEHPQLYLKLYYQLHAKIILIDQTLAVVGSANLTSFAWRNALEVLSASTEPSRVNSYLLEFEKLWSESRYL